MLRYTIMVGAVIFGPSTAAFAQAAGTLRVAESEAKRQETHPGRSVVSQQKLDDAIAARGQAGGRRRGAADHDLADVATGKLRRADDVAVGREGEPRAGFRQRPGLQPR